MEGRRDMIINELNILKKISQGHRYILTLVDYFESINNCKFDIYSYHNNVFIYFLIMINFQNFQIFKFF